MVSGILLLSILVLDFVLFWKFFWLPLFVILVLNRMVKCSMGSQFMNYKRYQIKCACHIYGITFIRYADNQKIGKPNNLNVFGSK